MQTHFAQLSNADLHTETVQAARHDRHALVHFLRLLGALDIRKAYREAGYSSTWSYLRGLGFSESESATRLVAARVVHRYPWVADDLLAARLHLTAVAMLGRRVLATGEEGLLAKARGLSKDELLLLLASTGAGQPRFAPGTAKRARVVPILAKPKQQLSAKAAAPMARAAETIDAPAAVAPTSADEQAPAREDRNLFLFAATGAKASEILRAPATNPETDVDAAVDGGTRGDAAAVPPQESDLYRTTLFLDTAAHSDLRAAQQLARHQVPEGDLNKVVALALREFVQKRRARKHGMRLRDQRRKEAAVAEAHNGDAPTSTSIVEPAHRVDAGQAPEASRDGAAGNEDVSAPGESALCRAPAQEARRQTRSRYIPAEVRRAVFIRDAGCCTFRSKAGKACGERQMLEYDHIVPFALGGKHILKNLRLRCRAHNALAAEAVFGSYVPTRLLSNK